MNRTRVIWLLMGTISCAGASPATDGTTGGAQDLPYDHISASDGSGIEVPTGLRCPESPVLGESHTDLTPFVRIRASGTRPRGLWPYESEDGPATVRDDHPDTSWKVPLDGEESWIEMDLVPWARRALPLSTIRWDLEGDPPTAVEVVGRGTCGGPERFRIPWQRPFEPLDLEDRQAGCLRIVLRPSGPLAVRSLSLSSRDADLPVRPDPAPIGPPRFVESGVIEGFYGVPWSFRERKAMLEAVAFQGLGTYLYAPKNDPLHRDRWREPYPDDDRVRFRALAQEARRLGLRVFFGLSPFIDYRGDEEDYRILRNKCRSLLEDGAHGIGILADDIEFAVNVPVDGAMGALHVAVVNRLRWDLGAAPIWFTPTVYSDRRARDWPGGMAYLEALRDLDPEVVVLWTGPDTGNASMAALDLGPVTATIGRKPLVWDNFYANDGGDGFFGRLFLAPYQGRAEDLKEATVGIAQNLSIQGGLSRLALGTFGAWLAEPGSSLEELRRKSVRAEIGRSDGPDPEGDSALLVEVMEIFDGFSSKDPPRDLRLESRVATVVASLERGEAPSSDAVGSLLEVLVRRASLESEVHHSGIDPDLVDELAFPLQKVRLEALVGLWAMGALVERLGGRDGSTLLDRADQQSLESVQCRYQVSPETIPRLLEAVRGFPVQARGHRWLDPPLPSGPCAVGHPMVIGPGPEGARIVVGGLRGTRSAGVDRVLWDPPHGGRYEGVVATWRSGPDPGWGFARFAIDCLDPCLDGSGEGP